MVLLRTIDRLNVEIGIVIYVFTYFHFRMSISLDTPCQRCRDISLYSDLPRDTPLPFFLIPPFERQASLKSYTPSVYYSSRLLLVQRGYTPPDLRLG